MIGLLQRFHTQLPQWADRWLDSLIVAAQVAGIALAAWLAMRLVRRLTTRLALRYALPAQVVGLPRRVVNCAIVAAGILWSLERIGVSGSVVWSAFTGFVTVGAVAFFAAWSVLSNLFCTLLIYMTGAFRMGDTIELLETGDKPGYKGRVVDINLVYTTLQDVDEGAARAVLQLPNSLFFQRVLRRWR
ncbi:membrane protein [Pseudorhodoferax aquiterrae]|uniref:Small-conductance mechanosensitive channel n=1 Tax=Pseudorhodoferax aquiterrae TaxID=747304 RepID=A0ABQ3G8H0_9BURK|nr:mechanosensitive ion channel family protein [Pseudorhodoferax aquiterrae]GHC93039.1 membrane protein [Pseudorhodoferax aquiterrae]